MFADEPPAGAWTVVAQDPTFAGAGRGQRPDVAESNVVEFTLVCLDRAGDELQRERIHLSEDEAVPLAVLNAALHAYSINLRRRS
jgi:hypothetical protein